MAAEIRRESLTREKETAMDPITTAVLAALGQLAEPAVKDAYEAFKSLLVRKFGKPSDVVKAVETLEAKPDSAAGGRHSRRKSLPPAPAATRSCSGSRRRCWSNRARPAAARTV